MLLVSLLFAVITTGQNRNYPLDSITVEGNRILSAAVVAQATGLKVGDVVDPAAFDAARDRLLGSGYFETVAYRYRSAVDEGKYRITFEVKEIGALYPLRVEALGVTTEAVVAYLKAKDPLFTGKMPGTKPALDRAAVEIAGMLAGKEVAGRVITTGPDQFEIEFMPKRGLPVVSTVAFEGSRAISALELRNKIAQVAFGQPYTVDSFLAFLDNQIRPAFEAKGYMRVAFTKITTSPSNQVEGLDVKVVVEDGPVYQLSGVTIRGGAVGERPHLLKLAKIPKMTTANFDEIRDGAGRVREGMHHDGYLDADVSVDKKIYDADKTVEAFIVVEPGPLYTFGTLTVNGLGLDGEAAIRKMWSVNLGDPYPEGYPNYFAAQVKKEGLFDNLGDVKAIPDINRKTHVADVTLEFKTGPGVPKAPRRPGRGPF